jgi:hypothetical protein
VGLAAWQRVASDMTRVPAGMFFPDAKRSVVSLDNSLRGDECANRRYQQLKHDKSERKYDWLINVDSLDPYS